MWLSLQQSRLTSSFSPLRLRLLCKPLLSFISRIRVALFRFFFCDAHSYLTPIISRCILIVQPFTDGGWTLPTMLSSSYSCWICTPFRSSLRQYMYKTYHTHSCQHAVLFFSCMRLAVPRPARRIRRITTAAIEIWLTHVMVHHWQKLPVRQWCRAQYISAGQSQVAS